MFESVPDLQRAVGDAVSENDQPTSFSFFNFCCWETWFQIWLIFEMALSFDLQRTVEDALYHDNGSNNQSMAKLYLFWLLILLLNC